MDATLLKSTIEASFPEGVFAENNQYTEIIIPVELIHTFCRKAKESPELQFDFLFDLTAVDWNDHFMMVYHLHSAVLGHSLVVKSRLNHGNPETDSLSDVWKAAEYYEREVFDLFGIRFRNHPDLRRLFLEDDFGYPLRKDFKDDSRVIVK